MPPTTKLTILFLAANPVDMVQLSLDEEMRAIDQELLKTTFHDCFDLRSAWAVRYSDLQGLLLRYQPHIVHFSGHGSGAGEIVLMDPAGKAYPVQPEALTALFEILKDNVRCVVLNACYSSKQARGIARSIDCVVGMGAAVEDSAAIDFATGFYLGLGYGRSVKTAFELGRNRINLAGLEDEQRKPMLVVRRGVKSGEVLLLPQSSSKAEVSERALSTANTVAGDYIARDKIIQGDEVRGDKIAGDKTEVHIERVEAGGQVILGDVHIEQAPPIEIPAPPEPARPPEPSGFVGREQELTYYADQLHTTGLAIICGMAGAGKTALASVLARRVAEPDRVFWHSFHAQEGFRSIVWHLAGFLAHHGKDELWRMLQSTRQTGGQPTPDEMLFDYAFQLLRGQGYLLCLDDLQFVDDEPLFTEQVDRLQDLLAAGELKLIVTSARMPSFVSSTEVKSLDGLREADTRTLLTARGLSLADTLVADLQRQTGGNAQLLTLAVDALHHSRDPAQLIAHLPETDDIDRYLLREVDRALTPEQRAVMEAVSVLLGHFGTRAAIEAITTAGGVGRILRDLSSRYLLIVREAELGKLYGLHAMLEAFYYDLLGQRERTALHLRAGEYYVKTEPDVLKAARHYQHAGETARAAALATQDVWSIINQGQAQPLQLLLDDLTPDSLDTLQRAQVDLARGQTYALLGDGEAARQSFESALQMSAALPATDDVRGLRARVYEAIGRLLEQESPQEAMQWLQRGLEELAGIGGPAEAALQIRIGSVHIAVGDYDAALTALRKGLDLLPEGSSQLRASALLNIGNVYSTQGDTKQGTAYTQQALAISRELHDLFWMLAVENNLGIDKEISGDWQGAVADYKEALALAEQLGSAVDRARVENSLGTLYIKMGEDAQAETHLMQAIESARRYKNREDLAYCLATLADLRLRQGALDAVEPLLDEAEQLVTELDLGLLAAEISGLRAQVDLTHGSAQDGLVHAKRAVARARKLEQVREEGRFLRILASAQAANQQNKSAQRTLKQSLDLLAEREPYEAACTKLAWGKLLVVDGNKEQGEILLHEAAATFRQLGAQRELAGLLRD